MTFQRAEWGAGYTGHVRGWVETNGVTIFVEDKTLELCKKTEAIETISCRDIKVSYPCAYFSLPRGCGISIRGDSYDHAVMSYDRKDDCIDMIWFTEDIRRSPVIMCFYLKEDCSILEQVNLNYEGMLENVRSFRPLERQSLERDAFESFSGLMVNFLLIIQNYPQYVTRMEGNDRKLAFSGQTCRPHSFVLARSAIRDMNQIVEDGSKETAIGTHSSPHDHWRRGHWRRQPHGDLWEIQNPKVEPLLFEDNRHYHMQWIEPAWIVGEAFTEIQKS